MEIIVKGEAVGYFRPEKVKVDLTFETKELKYTKAVENGEKNVAMFIEEVLTIFEMSNEDLKTNFIKVIEDKKFNHENGEYEIMGYIYTQVAYVEFDYNLKKVSNFIKLVSRLNSPPCYVLNFKLKNEIKHQNSVLNEACKNAEEKARNIAKVHNLKLKKCKKVSFEPLLQDSNSKSSITSSNLLISSEKINMIELGKLDNIFNPEDIMISEQVYCLWKAK